MRFRAQAVRVVVAAVAAIVAVLAAVVAVWGFVGAEMESVPVMVGRVSGCAALICSAGAAAISGERVHSFWRHRRFGESAVTVSGR